ncbi:MAG: acetate--CoA ligase family protein [Gammaproteobacteria bacterium]|nr:MAG: acetate--CoA ligase family protein [Gammaproteobacteria bacterium]TLY87041.1 MAG: acetate--CoA ligase family protein [Gammaproteobacteria bacterium]
MNARALQRLLAPRTIALVGGAWADAALAASAVVGYTGEVWRVHPSRASSAAQRYFRAIDELPHAPDATFIAAPNREVPAIAAALARRGAGGFVCFAAGFSETATVEGERLTQELLASADELPFLGPNCYGFINFFDGAALWPDQVVGGRRERGVALICQSGTIALNLLFNDRSLPIGCVLTVGNQTRVAAEDLIELLCADARVTAFGLYLEGLHDAARFAQAAARARAAGKPIALIKAGRTAAATRTVRTHTGALAGADATFDALCAQAGIARCETLGTLCETLKIFHVGGPLRGRRVLTMGASGGDMAMTVDAARHLGLDFAPIPAAAAAGLRDVLSDRVSVSNPFDFHTHVWFDYPRQRAMFGIAQRAGFDAVGFLIDCPPASAADDSAYVRAIEEFAAALPGADSRGAVISSLPESLSRATREKCLAAGIVPLQGQREALEALDLAGAVGETWARGAAVQLHLPRAAVGSARTLAEHEGKRALAAFGVPVPRSRVVPVAEAAAAAVQLGFPLVIKATAAALEHKSEVGGVVLNVRSAAEAEAAAQRLAALSATVLVEEMVTDGVAEMLVGVTVDPQFGQLLVLGAGGVLTELLRDSVSLLPPFTAAAVAAALGRLKVASLLAGYRGRPPADVAALVQTALACTRYAAANLERLVELDLNPVIVRPAGLGAVAVDALIRLEEH